MTGSDDGRLAAADADAADAAYGDQYSRSSRVRQSLLPLARRNRRPLPSFGRRITNRSFVGLVHHFFFNLIGSLSLSYEIQLQHPPLLRLAHCSPLLLRTLILVCVAARRMEAGFYSGSAGFIGSYRVLPGLTGSNRVLPSITGFRTDGPRAVRVDP